VYEIKKAMVTRQSKTTAKRNFMAKLPHHGTFIPLFHAYLDLGLSYHQAALVAYIDKWNRSGKECFASVEEIAQELRLPYRTMRRVIDRSITDQIIVGSIGEKGRARTLKITSSFLDKVDNASVQTGQTMCPEWTDSVSKVDKVCVQNGQLPISIPINIPKPNHLDININKLISKPKSIKNLDLESEFRDPEYLEFKKRLLANKAESPKCNHDELPD
jgi:DNA-binding MarR family transcriptional regulator